MNIEIIQSIFKTTDTVKKLENYSINENDIINKGYCSYIKIVYSVIKKCLKEFESEISIVDYMYNITSTYGKWKITFIFNENNLNRIYLTINDSDNMEIAIDLEPNEINVHLINKDDEYLIVKFKKKEIINDVVLCTNNIKRKKTGLNNLYDIINDISRRNRFSIQDKCEFWQKCIKIIDEVKKVF